MAANTSNCATSPRMVITPAGLSAQKFGPENLITAQNSRITSFYLKSVRLLQSRSALLSSCVKMPLLATLERDPPFCMQNLYAEGWKKLSHEEIIMTIECALVRL